jgi:hypothetical protein
MGARGTTFTETMTGSVRLAGEDEARPIRVDLAVRSEQVLLPQRTTDGALTGRIRITGWADDPDVQGELEISPLARRRIRYRINFTAEGRRYVLDGWKSISPSRPIKSMTVLPFVLMEEGAEEGEQAAEGTLRFPLTTQLIPFLASFRFPRADGGAAEGDRHLAPRWDGTPGRTEVWYTTMTDPATGTGLWLHHELVAPADGSAAYTHGWVARFPAGGESPVEHARFGPEP